MADASTKAAPSVGNGLTFERGDEVELADALLSELGDEVTFDEGAFHVYDTERGVWDARGMEVLESIVASFAGAPVLSAARARELALTHRKIVGAINIARARVVTATHLRFSDAAPGVAFQNGFVSVFQGQVILDPHHPAHMARQPYGLDYAPGAPHPQLDEFLEQVFEDASGPDRQQQIALLQEFLGTSLIGEATHYQRCLVLYGAGANGKSSLLEIAQSVFPSGAVASIPPQEWSKRFGIAGLVGALANLVNEIPEQEIVANAVFKSVISGEPVQAERKYRDAFSFRPRAGHIFAANSLPATNDQSQGFWRRLMVIPFTRDMGRAPGHRKNAAAAIVTSERAAIIGWALDGAARVQRQGHYTEPASSQRVLIQWRNEADSVRYFIEAECQNDPAKRTPASVLYQAYKIWALDNGFRPTSSINFGRRASQAGHKSVHTAGGNVYSLGLKRA